jgi:hypothetical protein
MRSVLIILTCVAAGAATAQGADPAVAAPPAATAVAAPVATAPAAAPAAGAAPAATPASTTPATPAAPAAAASATSTELTAWERELIAKGYKPGVYNGQKMYCHAEEVLGSRLGGHKVCATADQLAIDKQNAKELTERTQKMPVVSQ